MTYKELAQQILSLSTKQMTQEVKIVSQKNKLSFVETLEIQSDEVFIQGLRVGDVILGSVKR